MANYDLWLKESKLARERISRRAFKAGLKPEDIPDIIGHMPGRVTSQELGRLKSLGREDFITDNGHLILGKELKKNMKKVAARAPKETEAILKEVNAIIKSELTNEAKLAEKGINSHYATLIREALEKSIAIRGNDATAQIIKKKGLQEDIQLILGYTDADRKRMRLNAFVFALLERPMTAEESLLFNSQYAEIQETDEGESFGEPDEEEIYSNSESKIKYKTDRIMKAYADKKNDPLYVDAYETCFRIIAESNDVNKAMDEVEKILGDSEF